MSLQGRISELANKHRQLDQKIEEEEKRPALTPFAFQTSSDRNSRLKKSCDA